ncbi:MAG: type II toxin-antitoxin system VapC family toxin [Thermoplasmata archaeon]
MKCVDSDFLIAVLRGEEDALPVIEELDDEGGCTTAISIFELYVGAHLTRREHLIETERLLSRFSILSLEGDSARLAGRIFADLVRKGKSIDIKDALIAGIVLNSGTTLITRNTEHFKNVRGLKIGVW